MSREYEALFNEMSKTPALPAGITETPSLVATMPNDERHAALQGFIAATDKRHPGAYAAESLDGKRWLIIVPSMSVATAAVGSEILAIAPTIYEAWRIASEVSA